MQDQRAGGEGVLSVKLSTGSSDSLADFAGTVCLLSLGGGGWSNRFSGPQLLIEDLPTLKVQKVLVGIASLEGEVAGPCSQWRSCLGRYHIDCL